MPDKTLQKKILITRDIPASGLKMLEEAGHIFTIWQKQELITQEELINLSKQHEALLSMSSDKIDNYFLNECRHLNIISQYAAGYDNIDLAEATRLKIPVGNTPGVLSDATADVAFGLMIATARNMFQMHKTIINSEWGPFFPKADLGIELKNKTLGIFGLGRIGYAMAERCKGAFNMNIIYNNRNRNEKAEKLLNARYVSFDELLNKSDVISVHCKLSSQTAGIFNLSAFQKMKPEGIFINTSRGSVHDENDLITALNKKIIRGAGLDVTNPEPMAPNCPLLTMENVCVLPHIGSATVEARSEMARLSAENIIEYYKNNQVPHILNPEVLRN